MYDTECIHVSAFTDTRVIRPSKVNNYIAQCHIIHI